MKTIHTSLIALSILCQCAYGESEPNPEHTNSFTIAFGSCGSQEHPLPIFDEVVKRQPDLFIFLGDNIYGDTKDMDVLRQKYRQLGNKPSYQNLKKHTEIIATWDDHDYGQNDAGKHYPHKEVSKQIFLEFFETLATRLAILCAVLSGMHRLKWPGEPWAFRTSDRSVRSSIRICRRTSGKSH